VQRKVKALNLNSRVEAILELHSLLSDMTMLYLSFPRFFKVSVKDRWIFFPPPLLPIEKDFYNFFILMFEYFFSDFWTDVCS